MNISDLKNNYKIVSAPNTPTQSSGTPTNISQLAGNYQTQPTQTPTPTNTFDPLNRNTTFAQRAGTLAGLGSDIVKGVYDTGKKIVKSLVTAPGTIATLGNYAPEGTYAGDTRKNIEQGMNPALSALKTGSEAILDVATLGEGTNLLKNKGIPAVTKYIGEKADARIAKDSAKITEMISPSATPKEAKLAQTQGRFIEGKPRTTFRSGTDATILPTQRTKDATQTIIKNIPNAKKMSPSELYKAVDTNIKSTATKLRPQMESTPIKPETITKINTDWESLKKSQLSDAPATEEANVAKRQAKFESLLKKSGSQSHADLWDTRIKYDDSIPENVKKANDTISHPDLWLQKQEWLDNRKILNDAIDSTGKPEFKQMSDMYEAKNGLLSKTKVTKGQPSRIKEFAKKHPIITSGVIGETGRKIVTGGF